MPKPLFITTALLLLSIFSATSYGQAPPVQWKRCYGGSNYETSGAIRQLSDGSFILCGTSNSSDGDLTSNKGTDDAWLTKVDATGAVTWQQTYGGNVLDATEHFTPTTDGGYAFIGYASSLNGDVSGLHGSSTISDIWVVKTSNNGTIQWQKCIGGTANDRGTSIQQTADSGFILSGWINSNDGDISGYHGNEDALVVKLDKTGSISWIRTIGGSEGDKVTSVIQTADGGYVFTGVTNSIDGDLSGLRTSRVARDLWVVKLGGTGAISWQKFFGGTSDQCGNRILQTADGGYIVAGMTNSNNGTVTNNYVGFDCWVLKLSSTGALSWQKTYGGSADDFANDIIAAHNGGYVFCGYTESIDHDIKTVKGWNDNDMWVVKIDDNGKIIWEKTYGGLFGDVGKSLIKTNDGGYAVLGTSNSIDGDVTGGHGKNDYWLVKLGQETLDVPGAIPGSGAKIFPTLTDRMVYVTLPPGANSLYGIRVLSMNGATVANFQAKTNTKSFKIDFDGFSTGSYLLQITYSDQSQETARVQYGK